MHKCQGLATSVEQCKSVSLPRGSPIFFATVMSKYGYTSLKLTWHLKIGHPKRKVVFQPCIFRCYVSFREGKPSNHWFKSEDDVQFFPHHAFFPASITKHGRIPSLSTRCFMVHDGVHSKAEKVSKSEKNLLVFPCHSCFSPSIFGSFPSGARLRSLQDRLPLQELPLATSNESP